jgi:hypothetical protein
VEDHKGSDIITAFIAGLVGIPVIFLSLVWVASLF